MRLIDADALKRNLERLWDMHDDYDFSNKDVWQEIENAPVIEPERKWIPVTEALPINDVDVIVSVLDNSGDTPYRFTSVGWCTPNGQYWVVDNEMCYGVIAWMPLPEPWKGDK